MADLQANYLLILPEIVLACFTLFVLIADLWSENKRALAYVSFVGVLCSLVALAFTLRVPTGEYFGRMIYADQFTSFSSMVILVAAALVILFSVDFVEKRIAWAPIEYYEVLLFATLGMLLMVSSRDLIAIYIGLELNSISSYVLAALLRKDPKSNEAGMKYFLNGALASAVLLYGISIIYGLTGTTYLPQIAVKLASVGSTPSASLLYAAVIFCIGGFGFKIAAAPFHLWAPDVYEGAPTPVTGFFSVGPKAATMAAIMRTFIIGLSAFGALSHQWTYLFAVLSVVSMFLGNLTALWQNNLKRMMAYSSIAHAGYVLTGVVAGAFSAADGSRLGVASALYYLLGYAIANLGLFAIITGVENATGATDLAGYRGLAKRSPALAWSAFVLFISLIGIPPTVGFFGKFFLFQATWLGGYTWLAAAMALNSVISVGYYYAVVRAMFFEQGTPETEQTTVRTGAPLGAAVLVSVVATVAVGLFASPFFAWATEAGKALTK